MRRFALILLTFLAFFSLRSALAAAADFSTPPTIVDISSREITLEWQTTAPVLAAISYGLTQKMREHTAVKSFRKFHRVTLKSLAPNRVYYYRVVITDNRGRKKASPLLTVATELDFSRKKATLRSPARIAAKSATSLTLSFATSEPSMAKIYYGSNHERERVLERSIAEARHQVLLQELSPLTAYNIRIVHLEPGGKRIAISHLNASTAAGKKGEKKPPAFVEGPAMIQLTPRLARIEWFTEPATKATLAFGLSEEKLRTFQINALRKRQTWNFNGLKPNQIYYYKIVIIDSRGARNSTNVLTFATPFAE